jgi:hypothetical protein
MTNWNSITFPTGATATAKVGLYSKDFTQILAGCKMIRGANCNAWMALDGWALGVFYTDPGVANTGYGLCFAELNTCVGYYFSNTNDMGAFYYSGQLMSATLPGVVAVSRTAGGLLNNR